MGIFNNILRHEDLSIWKEKERQILNDQSDPTPQLSGTDNAQNLMVIQNGTALAPFNSLLQSGTTTASLVNANSIVAFPVLRNITNTRNKSPFSQILALQISISLVYTMIKLVDPITFLVKIKVQLFSIQVYNVVKKNLI